MDRLQSMAVFVAAVENGSLSGAGRQLAMPLATVSRKVSELEAHLGTTLMRRSTRRLELTDAGRNYLAACKRIVADVDESERAAAGEYIAPRGDLAVSAPIVLGRLHVLPVVVEFLRAYDDVDLHLDLSDRAVNLLEDHVDVAIRVGQLADSSLIARPLGDIRQVICASPGYLADRGRPRQPEQLRAHDCITFEGISAPGRWAFGPNRTRRYVAVRSRLVVNTADAAIGAAIAGAGLTRVLSYQVAAAVGRGELEVVLAKFEAPASPVHLLYGASGGRLPLKTRAFIDFALPRLQAGLSAVAATARPTRSARARHRRGD